MATRPPPISLPNPAMLPDLPPVAALFLIEFDVKAGYTITWRKAVTGLVLDGVVEYKSLPSGLHTVSEDLIYFIHEGGYAGLSAFVNVPTDDEGARHARMIAVGILVPLSYGRLGRSWRHAEGLKEMAEFVTTRYPNTNTKDTRILEQYWDKNKAPDATHLAVEPLKDSPLSSPSITFQPATPKGHSRKRSASDANALIPPGHRLSPFHPAWSLTALLDTFGPLIFPLHRAALLRKRILISTHAPVHQACDFVYDISILSNIPLSVVDLIEPAAPSQRLRPLFTIGVNDIVFLTEDAAAAAALKKRRSSASLDGLPDDAPGGGWVACTTDSILAVKEDLWDVLITMPPAHASGAKTHVWPTVTLPGGQSVRATQRDLRRFRNLRAGISRLAKRSSKDADLTAGRPGTSSGWSIATAAGSGTDDPLLADAAEKVVEPTKWAALAYSGFMWWASAGEQRRSEEAEEAAHDASLLADLASAPSPRRRGSSASGGVAGQLAKGAAMADSVMSLPASGRRPAESRVFSGASDLPGVAVPEQQDGHDGAANEDEERARVELAIIAYFRRLTAQVLAVLADIVDSSEDDEDEGEEDLAMASMEDSNGPEDSLLRSSGGTNDDWNGSLHIDSDELARMGLDVWSDSDVVFVREVTERYFGRKAKVESKAVEICGLRVC